MPCQGMCPRHDMRKAFHEKQVSADTGGPVGVVQKDQFRQKEAKKKKKKKRMWDGPKAWSVWETVPCPNWLEQEN